MVGAALRELKDAELLEDEGNRGIHRISDYTNRGYEVADMIARDKRLNRRIANLQDANLVDT